jgi:WD40 repeat protein
MTPSEDQPYSDVVADHSRTCVENSDVIDAEQTKKHFVYDAFISYRRHDATKLAQWIRNKLRNYKLPQEIISAISQEKLDLYKRKPEIWLDTSYEKASDDFLLKKVFPALDNSAQLIVLSTPAALEKIKGNDGKEQDNWLVREVDHFLGGSRAGMSERSIDLVLGPGAALEIYPGRLAEKARWDWVDFRAFGRWRARFGDALDDGVTKLVASLYEIPDQLIPILRHEEQRRRNRAILAFGGVASAVAAVTIGLALYAYIERLDVVSLVENVLVSRAGLSVNIASNELQNKAPERALAAALSGVETPSIMGADRVIAKESISAIGNSIANSTLDDVLYGHNDAVLEVYVGKSGGSMLTIGADKKVTTWIRTNKFPFHPLNTQSIESNVFAVSQQAELIAIGVEDQVRVWAYSGGEPDMKSFHFGERPTLINFEQGGKRVAAAGKSGKVVVWNVQSGVRIWTSPTPVPNPSVIEIDPECNCVVIATSGNLVTWRFDDLNYRPVQGVTGRVIAGKFARGGEFIFTTDDRRIWRTSTRISSPAQSIGEHEGRVVGLAVSQDGTLSATVGSDGVVLVWDTGTRTIVKKIRSGDLHQIVKTRLPSNWSAVAFSPDAKTLALGYKDGTVVLWDIGVGDTSDIRAYETLVMRGHTASVSHVSFSPDGNWVASASMDRTARLWRLQTAERPQVQKAHFGTAFHAISNNGHFLISAGKGDKKLQLWSGSAWQLGESKVVEGVPTSVAVTNDGKRVYIGTFEGDLLEWTIGGATKTLSRENGVVYPVAISPDETIVATSGLKVTKMCRVSAPETECSEVQGLTSWGSSVTFSEDGKWFGAASGGEDRSGAVVLNLATGNYVRLPEHATRISSIRFDKAATKATTASEDGISQIWDIPSGKELARLEGPAGRVETAGFSSDGNWIATGWHGSNSIRLWPVPKGSHPGVDITTHLDETLLISDGADFGQMSFDPKGDFLAVTSPEGNIRLFHVPEGTLRVDLKGVGSAIMSLTFGKYEDEISATTEDGRLVSWTLNPLLRASDDALPQIARGIAPLPGALLTGKLQSYSGAFSDLLHLVTSVVWRTEKRVSQLESNCEDGREHYLGVLPHQLSGEARARELIKISDTCDAVLKQAPNDLSAGRISARTGDLATAARILSAAAEAGDYRADIGLGDLGIIDNTSEPDRSGSIAHYTEALKEGVPLAASRLGWVILEDANRDGDENWNNEAVSRARTYFEEGKKQNDADAFTGLAFIDERVGKTNADLQAAFMNYAVAQHLYEQHGDNQFAQQVAERRSTLARCIPPNELEKSFLQARASMVPMRESGGP